MAGRGKLVALLIVVLFYSSTFRLYDHTLVMFRGTYTAPPVQPGLLPQQSEEWTVLTSEPQQHHFNNSSERQSWICNNNNNNTKGSGSRLWQDLCRLGFVKEADMKLLQHQPVRIVQIGAHVGFEYNDHFARGMVPYLEMLSIAEKKMFQWSFVEPSPTNFHSLQINLAQHSHLCNLTAIHTAVVSDTATTNNDITTTMPFYSISDSIDPITGYDSRSGQKFPYWITQLSSFSPEPILFNRNQWTMRGLVLEDYMVQTNVTIKSYSHLMHDLMGQEEVVHPESKNHKSLLMVLIDTEGLDCSIILGISKSTPFLPRFLLFEHKQCDDQQKQQTFQHLQGMGYQLMDHQEDTLAWRPNY